MTIQCANCSISFNDSPSRTRRRFCSRKCYTDDKRHKDIMSVCKLCGKETENRMPGGNFYKKDFCSRSCATKYKRILNPPKTDESILARHQIEYREWRRHVFQRDDYTCQACGDRSRAGHRVTLNADHELPFSIFKDIRYEILNGGTLCVPCHKKTDTYGVKIKKTGYAHPVPKTHPMWKLKVV